jgi:spore germination protein KA
LWFFPVILRNMQTNFFHRGAGDGPHPRPQPQYDVPVTAGELKKIFSDCDDFETRTVRIGLESRLTVTVCWLDGVVSAGDVSTDVLRPLTEGGRLADIASTREALHRIEQGAVYSCSTRTRAEMDDVVFDLTNGSVALVFDAQRKAVTFEVRTSNVRAVSEPTIEKSVSGAKDAFVETLRINTSLVRRKLHTPALKLQQTVVGRQSETTVAVLYVDGIADPARVQRILDRLDTIDEQALLGRGDLEPYLTHRPRALLPQLGQTERPDKFAGALLDGCVGLLVDGLPMGYLLPTTFHLLMHAPEDESHHYLLASALIVLRYFALAISLMFPALYVAVAMYHQEMIPAKLLLSVIQAKQQVPFSVPAIILFMLIAFELLQEAGLRLPNSIGQTVSIIGSAVDAKVVSPVAIIVVALAGIAGYTLPNQELSNAVRLLRLGLVLAAALAGLFGILAMLGLVIWYLCTIDSDGVAYMAPFVDSERPTIFRTLLRRPQPDEKFRPPEYGSPNRRRQR